MKMHPRRPRRAALCAAAALAAGAAGPAAAAELTFRFDGRGWGHGVGMSQYGAMGYAQRGATAAQILDHYYPGTALTASPAVTVRVLLSGGVPAVTFTPSGGPAIVNVLPGNTVVPLQAGATYTVRAAGAGVRIEGPGGAVVAESAVSLRLSPRGDGIRAGADNHLYPGELVANPAPGGMNFINALDREAYLRGVVPHEMSPSMFPPAALQAQAVAARSYVTRRRDTGASSTWDVHDDTRSQVYRGLSGADPRSDAAIAATANRVLTYDGAVADALYSSTSGGYTESAANAFGSPVPYLVAVPDPYDEVSPLHRWSDPPVFTASALGARLGLGAPVATFTVTRRGDSPRVMAAQVTTATGATKTLTGLQIKARLGLRDTWFWVTRSDQARPTPEPPLPGGAPAAAVTLTHADAALRPRASMVTTRQRTAPAGRGSGTMKGDVAPSYSTDDPPGPRISTRARAGPVPSSGDIAHVRGVVSATVCALAGACVAAGPGSSSTT